MFNLKDIQSNKLFIWEGSSTFLISVILIVAALVRFWFWSEMQFHHDELSALMRTRFSTFSELITQGVWIDGHPAFTQVFLWFWTDLLGYSPQVVKLPFLLAGVASVYAVFLISRKIFSAKSAYVSASLMAVLQYSVVYSQWARPYAFGILFMLWAFYYLVDFTASKRKISLLGFAVFAALTAYTHYFALLQIIVLTALWFVFCLTRSQKLWLVIASIGACGFWLPHLSITLHHLSLGGIGDWLQVPNSDYWMDLLGFSFHYSWFLLTPLMAAVLAFNLKGRLNKKVVLLQGIFLGSWIIPYVIAYYYSVQVSALMHFGTMLFTFPSLVFYLGSVFTSFDRATSKIFVLFILFFGSVTLVDRSHYQLNVKTEFQDPIHLFNSLKQEYDVSGLFDLRSDAVLFLEKNGIESFEEVQLLEPLIDNNGLAQYVNDLTSDAVLFVNHAGTPKEALAQVVGRYSLVQKVYCYQSATAYLLLKDTSDDSPKNESMMNLIGKEYGEAVNYFPTDSLNQSNVVVSVDLEGERYNDAKLVVEWKSNAGTSLWQSTALSSYTSTDSVYHAAMAFDVRDVPDFEHGGKFTAYIWNSGLDSMHCSEAKFRQFTSNELRYGLFERIKK